MPIHRVCTVVLNRKINSVVERSENVMLNVFAMKLVIKECYHFQILPLNGLFH